MLCSHGGQRDALRLHAVLQHDRSANWRSPATWWANSDSRPRFRSSGAMGHSERVAVGRLRRLRQRLRRSVRERQQLAPVHRTTLLVDQRQAHLQVRRRDPARRLQPGRQPVRPRAVHVHAQRHAEPGADRRHRRSVRGLPAGRDVPGRSGRLDRRRAVPRDQLLAVLRRHLEDHARASRSISDCATS